MADTWTVGGATSGYWATGSCDRATTPTMTRTIDSTDAKMGRSMKKWEIMGERPSAFLVECPAVPPLRLRLLGGVFGLAAGRPGRHGDALRPDLDPGADALDAVYDHPLAGLEAGPRGKDAQVALEAPGRDRPVLDLVLAVDDSTYFWPWSIPIARSVTSRPLYFSPTGRRTRANWPGVRRPSLLGKTPRTWIVPVAGVILFSAKSMPPSRGKRSPSVARPRNTGMTGVSLALFPSSFARRSRYSCSERSSTSK